MSQPLWRSLQNLSRARGLQTSLRRVRHSSSTAGSNPGSSASGWLAPLAAAGLAFGAAVYAERQGLLGSLSSESSSPPRYADQAQIQSAIEDLRKTLPGDNQVRTNPAALLAYGNSPHSYYPGASHSVIVSVQSTDDVVKVVNISRKYKIPIVPYASATSLEGHYNGIATGSICLDMSGMDRILKINEADGDLVCQAGARWEDINRTLAEKGIPLFFPLDPGPTASIGGMIGTGCSGTNAVRYGTAKAEWFLNVTVVLPSGEVIKTRQRARKSSAGFDTTKLFIGAEGTLGIVTEATLRLAPVVPTKVAMAQFPDVEHAVKAVQELLVSPYGSNLQCIELLDDKMMGAINAAGLVDKPYPVEDSLFFKIQGAPEVITLASKEIQRISKKHGGKQFRFAATDAEAAEIWENRKYALISTKACEPDRKCYITDVCVPISRLPELVHETKKDLAENNLRSTIVGHVGDGNFHALIMFTDDEMPQVTEAVHRMVHRAIALDGTCTGEHGIGLGKKKFLVEELGEGTVELMRTVKKVIDPDNLFNPGKLYVEKDEK